MDYTIRHKGLAGGSLDGLLAQGWASDMLVGMNRRLRIAVIVAGALVVTVAAAGATAEAPSSSPCHGLPTAGHPHGWWSDSGMVFSRRQLCAQFGAPRYV
ncbi:MAG: hypothetical protein ACR2QA_06005, partial [Solirubrobacteraceae bacterium]